MSKARVIVIGGGAAGLMTAIQAARQGARVTILEHMDRVGKKILSTGNGKCNFTNTNQDIKNYHGANPEFIKGILEQFDHNAVINFFQELGLLVKDRNGYMYPNSGQASTVLDLLRNELTRLDVKIVCQCQIKSIVKNNKYFKITTNQGNYESDSIVLATGSKAAPSNGSDGSGYDLAKEFGHRIERVVPALVQLRCKGDYFKSIAGVRTDAKVSLLVDDNLIANDTGELQLTDYGISGIPVFQVSRYASLALGQKKKVNAIINFLPDYSKTSVTDMLIKRLALKPDYSLCEALNGMLNKKLIAMLIKESGLSLNQTAKDLSKEQIICLADNITDFNITVTGTNSFDKAQVCAGGVSVLDINLLTLESKLVDGLYFAGELLDVDGACGGYNLQWAWSSAYVAAINAAKV